MTTVSLEIFQQKPQETTDDQLVIEMPKGKLPVGAHKFGLTVADDAGNDSVEAVITVVIVDLEKPTAVLQVLDAKGLPVFKNRIPFGASFTLSGTGSTDVDTGGGNIKKYVWKLL